MAAGHTFGPSRGFPGSAPASVRPPESSWSPSQRSPSSSMPQLKLSLRSSLASSYIFVEPGLRYPWWNRLVPDSRLTSSGSRKNSSAARRARSMMASFTPWFRT